MKKLVSILKKELEDEGLKKIDNKMLSSIRGEIASLSTILDEETFTNIILDNVKLLVETRMSKAIKGKECRECYDSELLNLVKSMYKFIEDIMTVNIPLTQDLKVPVRALIDLNLPMMKAEGKAPIKVKAGSIFYASLKLTFLLLSLGLVEIVK